MNNISEEVIEKIAPYIYNEEFTPIHLGRISLLCEAVCMRIRACYMYHTVCKRLEPTMKPLNEARSTRKKTMAMLAKERERMDVALHIIAHY